ncbi:MAG: hypothetical protein LBR74_07855 [Eubacterium sp.]|jgi:CHASE2 domain-containing sensor protein|nr:hypothetical protein [Eubacterium sp.]
MKPKSKMTMTLIISIAASCLFVGMFVIDYMKNFMPVFNLLLFSSVLITIVAWSWYSVALGQYRESLNPTKRKTGSGNRSNRRKG